MIEAYQPETEAALDIVAREIEFARVEKTAFERFHRRVKELEPTTSGVESPPLPETTGLKVHSQQTPKNTAMRTIRDAYQETVMDVPHYESEYGEGFEENIAAELGRSIAIRLVEGDQLTPTFHEILMNAVAQACEERSSFLELLQQEQESLREVKETLNHCETRAATIGQKLSDVSREEHADFHAELCSIEVECETLSKERQQLLHHRSVSDLSGISFESLTGFLYGPRQTTCPALADIADCLDTVRYYKRKTASGQIDGPTV